jgi:hypothetical protein
MLVVVELTSLPIGTLEELAPKTTQLGRRATTPQRELVHLGTLTTHHLIEGTDSHLAATSQMAAAASLGSLLWELGITTLQSQHRVQVLDLTTAVVRRKVDSNRTDSTLQAEESEAQPAKTSMDRILKEELSIGLEESLLLVAEVVALQQTLDQPPGIGTRPQLHSSRIIEFHHIREHLEDK